jgi:hypothetical protein
MHYQRKAVMRLRSLLSTYDPPWITAMFAAAAIEYGLPLYSMSHSSMTLNFRDNGEWSRKYLLLLIDITSRD